MLPALVATSSDAHPALACGLAATAVGADRSLTDLLRQALAGSDPVIALVHDSITPGVSFGVRVETAVADLSTGVGDRWAVLAAAGLTHDGIAYDEGRLGRISYRTSGPVPVIDAGGGALVVNLAALRSAGYAAPDMPGWDGADTLLALGAGAAGLTCAVDSRTYSVRSDADWQSEGLALLESEPARHVLDGIGVGGTIPTRFGPADTGLPPAAVSFQSLGQRASAARLGASRPVVTVVTRTMFDRPVMLRRTAESVAAAHAVHSELDLRWLITSTADVDGAEVEALRASAPDVDIDSVWVDDPQTPSRTAQMVWAFQNVEADHLWFVDDDDFLVPDGVAALIRSWPIRPPALLVGDVRVFDETWEGSGADARLLDSEPGSRYHAETVWKGLTGGNFMANAGVLYPVGWMRERLRGIPAAGDFFEDYFFLMLALTGSDLDLRPVGEVIAGISRHGGDQATSSIGIEARQHSFATFVGDLLDAGAGSPLLWELGNRLHTLPDRSAARHHVLAVSKVAGDDVQIAGNDLLLENRRQRVRVAVDGSDCDHVRLDWGSGPALIEFEALDFLPSAGGGPLPLPVEGVSKMLPIPATGGPRFLSVGRDPWMLVRPPAEAGELRSIHTFRPLASLDHLDLDVSASPEALQAANPIVVLYPPGPDGRIDPALAEEQRLEEGGSLVEFSIEAVHAGWVRFDPAVSPGYVEVRAVTVRQGRRPRTVPIDGMVVAGDAAEVSRRGGVLSLLATGPDPQLSIQFGSLVEPGEPAALTVELFWRPL